MIHFNNLVKKIFKVINSFIFSILPKKITSFYVTLSILAFIYNIRSIQLSKDTIKVKDIERDLRIGITDDLLVFPEYSLDLLWEEDIIKKTFIIEGKNITFKEIILDNTLFYNNIRLILDTLLEELPKGIKNNLNVDNYADKKILEYQIEMALVI